MSGPRLSFKDIQILKMPGFTRYGKGFETGELSSGINVVYGPNGSGKTTIAKAIEAVLWPDSGREYSAEVQGRLRLGPDEMTFSLDGARRTCRRQEVETDLPLLPPPALRGSYSLALHVLLNSQNEQFAEEIEKESIGGFNIAAAKSGLGLKNKPSSPNALKAALEKAQAALDGALAEQAQRKSEEDELAAMRQQRDRAGAAQTEAVRWELALRWKEAQANAEETRRVLSEYPEVLARVGADALERARNAQADMERCQQEAQDARARAETTRKQIAELDLCEGGVPAAVTAGLNEHVERLRRQEDSLAQEQRDLEQARAERADAEKRMEGLLPGADLGAFGVDRLSELRELVEQQQALDAEKKANEVVRRWLRKEDVGPDAETLKDGIKLLQKWLRSPGEPAAGTGGRGRTRAVGIVSSALLAILVVILAAAFAWAWLVMLVAPLSIAVWAWGEPGQTAASSPGTVHAADYALLELPQPESWEFSAVAAVLEDLNRLRGAVELEESKRRILADYDEKRNEWVEREKQLEQTRAAAATALGVAADLDGLSLYVLAEDLVRWRKAHSNVEGREARCRDVTARRDAELASLNTTLAEYGYAPAATTIAGIQNTQALAARDRQYRELAHDLKTRQGQVFQLEQQAEAAHERMRQEFEPVGLAAGDFAGLTAYGNQKPAYEEADAADKQARAALGAVTEDVRKAGLDTAELEGTDVAALQARHERARLDADKRDALADEVSRAEQRIETAKHGHSVEDALENVDRARRDLETQREKDYGSAVGAALADYLEEQVRDVSRPKVFRRANELFGRITRGRYELRFRDQDGESGFAAWDTTDREPRLLDQLSSGTRLQLLLSVRIAFVEKFETEGVKLPLVFDEVLANTDDDRTMALLDVIKMLTKDGRQVFYFTAQNDEVAKWRTALEQWEGAEPAFIDLAKQRALSQETALREIKADWPGAAPVPSAAGCSHDAYRAKIGVPRFNPHAAVDDLHVWYLFSNAEDVEALLKKGVVKWGQLKAMQRINDRILPGREDALARARESEHIIQTYLGNWRIGRAAPISAAVIAESGAIQSKYMDAVAELLEQVNGDAAGFMARCTEIKGPRTATWDKVRAYLEEKACLDDRDAFPDADLRTRVLVSLSPDISEDRVDATLRRLCSP